MGRMNSFLRELLPQWMWRKKAVVQLDEERDARPSSPARPSSAMNTVTGDTLDEAETGPRASRKP